MFPLKFVFLLIVMLEPVYMKNNNRKNKSNKNKRLLPSFHSSIPF